MSLPVSILQSRESHTPCLLPLLPILLFSLLAFPPEAARAQAADTETAAKEVAGGELPKQPDKSTKAAADGGSPLSALRSVLESIRLVDEEIAKLSADSVGVTEVEREEIQAEIASLNLKRKELARDFDAIATGVNPEDYDGSVKEPFVLANEVDTLLRPIIEELKDLTEKPREIEQLRSDLEGWKRRLATADIALLQIETLPAADDEELSESITRTRLDWQERKTLAENRIRALSYQLEQAEKNQPSMIRTFGNSIRGFFRSRGRNFLLCVAVFFISFFGFRYLHKQLDHLFPWRKKTERPFYLRLIDVGLNVFSLIGAVAVTMIVLYATGDWVLMGLAIIILLGLVLAAKNGLPKFYDQARILLNLGEVREGERVVYQGVPWKVERLSFYTILRNEQLRGGMVRLPVAQLRGLVSRPISREGEPWFPCNEGDWVILPDEGIGRVVSQTPEYVQLVKLGGSKITMPTSEFLTKSPENLSGSFRINTTFGIDYRHQADITSAIPETMWTHLTREICAMIGDHEKLLSLKVEFASAGTSSLDLAIIADFDGSLAPKYQVIERALQRMAVDSCNENGWVIPFTQITLHNAYPGEEKQVVPPKDKKPRLP